LKRRAAAGGVCARGVCARVVCGASAAFATLLEPSSANGQTWQVHWDAGIGVGVMQRATTGGERGAPSPLPGPVAEAHAHVALLPMLRAGPYVSHDISPVDARPARQMTEAGLRFKVTPPLVRRPWRVWAFAGLGYARTYAPSYVPIGALPVERMRETEGGILDMPFGVGAGVKLRGPWLLFGELGARVGWVFAGSMYRSPPCSCDAAYLGEDSFAAALTVGVSLEE